MVFNINWYLYIVCENDKLTNMYDVPIYHKYMYKFKYINMLVNITLTSMYY